MVDEWLDGSLALSWDRPGEVAWGPVETVSLSEAGYERIYQGSAILVSWPLALRPGDAWEVAVDVQLARPARILLESVRPAC
jgi:alpha-amylase